MKKIVLALSCLISTATFAQDNMIDIIMDGKPAKMNTTTGEFTFTNGTPKDYALDNTLSVSNASNTNTNTHTVVRGETLYSISKKYQISTDQLKSLNNLETNVLSLNQQLKITNITSPVITAPSVYIVEKGDTLYGIARKVNLSTQELKQLNNLESNTISIGQELTVK